MTTSYIFGAGGHARVIASMLQGDVRFVVRDADAGQISETDFFDRIEDYRQHPVYLGIGNNVIRRKLFDKLSSFDAAHSLLIAPSASVARDAQVEKGAVICPGSVIGSRAIIGANTIVNTLSSVDHDCVLGAHSQVTAGVTIAGTVTIGTACFFGVKSAVIPGIKIGSDVTVMAGSLVTKDCADRVTVGGSPARVMRAD